MTDPAPSRATAFVNGRVLPMTGRPDAMVVVVRDGRIAEVGDAGAEQRHPDARVIDLGGATITPGLIDAHQHLSLAALHPRWADLAGVRDLDTARDRLVAAAEAEPDAPWIRAAGWDAIDTGLGLTRTELDAMGFDRPILVGCFSYHRAVVSSAGLDALGISAATPDPPGGRIERDAAGHPTGMLVETAWSAAHAASLAGYDDPDRWGDLIVQRAEAVIAEGITAVHDAACTARAEAVYRSLADTHRLPLSVLVMPHGPMLAGPDPDRFDGPPTGEGDEWVRVGPVKLFADGGIEVAIDAHLGGHPVVTGGLMPGLEASMRTATERGFAIAVHAMGNLGLRHTLDSWELVSAHASAPPARIEHVTLAGAGEIERMRGLGVIGVVQPGFVELIGRSIGDLRFDDATWLPFRDLLDAGIPLAASSDGPCHITDPLVGAAHGATRLTAAGGTVGVDEAVPLRTWLELYTAGAADAGGQANERGRLRPGLRADLTVLDGDVDGTDALSVRETWVAGERVFTRADR